MYVKYYTIELETIFFFMTYLYMCFIAIEIINLHSVNNHLL